MEKTNIIVEIKMGITAAVAALTAWLGVLAMPLYLLVMLGIADYFTGLAAAPKRGEQRNSYKGMMGIAKKVCILLLVGVSAAVDGLLLYISQTMGIVMPFKFFIAAAVAVWLICNEIISILENIDDIGVKVPPFLRKLIEWVRKTTEDKADINKGSEVK